jgi:CheY-like chemotaxis protein
MNTPLPALPASLQVPDSCKKKRVLLVDTSTHNRDLRAETMRKLEIDVDCAADIGEARCWWRADLYDLVLIDMEKGVGHRDRFCQDVRGATPPQRLAFLVGEPEYLADLPREDQPPPVQNGDDQFSVRYLNAARYTDLKDPTQRWGIMEASRRISAVRSACSVRTMAMRDRPAPPRDSDARAAKRNLAPLTLDDLLREERQ